MPILSVAVRISQRRKPLKGFRLQDGPHTSMEGYVQYWILPLPLKDPLCVLNAWVEASMEVHSGITCEINPSPRFLNANSRSFLYEDVLSLLGQ